MFRLLCHVRRILQYMLPLLAVAGMHQVTTAQSFPHVDTHVNGHIIDDKVYERLLSEGRRLINEGGLVPLSKLLKQLDNQQCHVTLTRPHGKTIASHVLYNSCKESVLVIGTIFRCNECPNDHVRAATGFAIAPDGTAVTSYHIFKGDATNENLELAHFAMDFKGNVYPINAVLAAHKGDDVAIIQLRTGGHQFVPLPLGNNPAIGEEVTIIAHPHAMFYSLTQGAVSRFYMRNEGEKMSITADFGQGSSGGPVFDNKGNVVGVVSATLSLYNSDNNLQMVSKETIPVARVKALLATGNP